LGSARRAIAKIIASTTVNFFILLQTKKIDFRLHHAVKGGSVLGTVWGEVLRMTNCHPNYVIVMLPSFPSQLTAMVKFQFGFFLH
jgi:hypothetical protein